MKYTHILTCDGELYHYGVKGMKWGVHKTHSRKMSNAAQKSSAGSHSRKPSSFKTIRVSKKEYAHVMSELATNITDAQRKSQIIIKLIGKNQYVFKNNFDGTYEIIGRKQNPGVMKKTRKGQKK